VNARPCCRVELVQFLLPNSRSKQQINWKSIENKPGRSLIRVVACPIVAASIRQSVWSMNQEVRLAQTCL
jgi:hypothetical protein